MKTMKFIYAIYSVVRTLLVIILILGALGYSLKPQANDNFLINPSTPGWYQSLDAIGTIATTNSLTCGVPCARYEQNLDVSSNPTAWMDGSAFLFNSQFRTYAYRYDNDAEDPWYINTNHYEFGCVSGFRWEPSTHTCLDAITNQCPAQTTLDTVSGLCEEDTGLDCTLEEGNVAASGPYFGPLSSFEQMPIIVCVNGCQAIYNGTNTKWTSSDPGSFYFEGEYNYEGGFACTSGDSPPPSVNNIPPPDAQNPPGPVEDPNDCASKPRWEIDPITGACQIEGSADNTSGNSAETCAEGSYFSTELGRCIGYNSPGGEPVNPTTNTSGTTTNEPTGGSDVDSPQTGGSDGGGIGTGSSGTDTDGDGETNDESICVQHPDLDICKISSHVDKGCSSPPACSGDAIQCAMDKKLWSLNCTSNLSDANIKTTSENTTAIKDLLEENFVETTDPTMDIDESALGLPPLVGSDDGFIHQIVNITELDLTGAKRYSSTCPQLSVNTLSFGLISFDFTNFCLMADSVGLIVAFASIIIGLTIVFVGRR